MRTLDKIYYDIDKEEEMITKTDRDIRIEGMTEYRLESVILAKPLDRDTAGRTGYLPHFDGSSPEDKSPGYAFYDETLGTVRWASKKDFESILAGKDVGICKDCIRWDKEKMYCDTIYTHTTSSFGCNKFYGGEDV